MTERKRVVVTGVGVVSPIGLGGEAFWASLMAGRGGIAPIRSFPADAYKSKNGAEVDSTLLSLEQERYRIRSVDRVVDMAQVAAAQALEGAGLFDPAGADPMPRAVATIIGSGGGPSPSIEESYANYAERGLRGIRPTTIVRCMMNAVSSLVSMRFRLTGPNFVISSACASSTNAIGMAYRMIRDGHADRALCGGSDSFFTPGLFGAWDQLGVMSRNPDPGKASRPFDTDRDGFVLGEGAGMLLLESLDGARERGAVLRGEIRGYGESSDAHHLTAPSEDGQCAAMRAAMEDAGVTPREIGFVNAHGTATRANDLCESRSLRRILGDAAPGVWVASNKSFFGHLLGAAGVVETVATLLGLEQGRVPPNLHLEHPDPAAELRLVGPRSEPVSSPLAMKNSFGFGGGNAVLILGKAPGGDGQN